MAVDYTARALATRALERTGPAIDDYGTLSSDDWEATRIAFRDAFAAGVERLALQPGTYLCGTIPADEEIAAETPYQQPAIILPPGFKQLDGRHAELVFTDGRGIHAVAFTTWAHPTPVSDLASPVQAGDTQVHLVAGEGANWQPGDAAIWRFGSIPADKPEPLDWGIANIKAVTGDTLTLDRPLPAPFDPASVDGDAFTSNVGTTWYNRSLHRWPLFDDLEVIDLTGTGMAHEDETWAEEFISVRGARRVRIARCGGRRVGIAFGLQYVEGATLTDCWAEDAATFQPSVGKGINLAECRDVEIRNFRGVGLRRCIHLEAHSEARVFGGLFENVGHRSGTSYGSDCIVFGAMSRSRLTVRDFTVTGHGDYVLTAVSTGDPAFDGVVEFDGRLTLIHPTEPFALRPNQFRDLLDYRIAGARELWDFGRPKLWRRRIYLRNGLYQNVRGPCGVISRMRVYASSGLTFGATGKVTGFYVGREGANGLDMLGELQAGAEKELTFLGGTVGGILWTMRSEQLKILLQTEAGTSLNAADAYLDVECEIAIDRLAGASTWLQGSDERLAGPEGGLREAYFPAHDIPAIAANGIQTVDFPVPAASNNDLIMSVDYAGNLGNVSIRHVESIGGALRVIFANHSGASIDPAPSDIRILWRKSLTTG